MSVHVCDIAYECILMWTYSIPPLQAQLQLAVEQMDMFHQSYQSLDAGLGGMEESSIPISVPGFKPLYKYRSVQAGLIGSGSTL